MNISTLSMHIIFDFDGVIHDTFELSFSLNKAVIGEHFDHEQFRRMFTGNVYSAKEITKEGSDQYFALQQEAFKALQLEQEMHDFLLRLKETHTLHIISSNREIALNLYFENSNATDLFTSILGEETHRSKVEKFRMIFEKYNCVPDNCLFVTDTLGDICEAHEVGVRTIAVDFGFHERARLAEGNPYAIVSSLQELELAIKNVVV